MSTTDTIFLSIKAPLGVVADRLCSELGLKKVVDKKGSVYLGQEFSNGVVREVGGEISENPYLPEEDPTPDEISILDGYEVAWVIRVLPMSEERLHITSRELFMRVVSAIPAWPALLVQNLDALVAASRPGIGLMEFPDGISPDGDAREMWRPYDVLDDGPRRR
jgi:hypothetical protein